MKKNKKKRRKVSKKETPHSVYKKCLKLAGDIAKTRDCYICQHCGESRESGRQMQASHVIPKSRCKRLAVEPVNIKCLCSYCHRWWWHLSPVESGLWFTNMFPDRWSSIKILQMTYDGRKMGIADWRQRYHELKLQFEEGDYDG
jgi:hypothetical protein